MGGHNFSFMGVNCITRCRAGSWQVARHAGGRSFDLPADAKQIVLSALGRGTSRRDVMTRIAFAIALVLAGLASIPASAGPGDEQYSAGYQDNAYNRHD